MEITKKGIQIMTAIITASLVQDPIFALGAMIFLGLLLVSKGGEVRKFWLDMEDLRVKIVDKAQEYKVISRSSGPLLKGINPKSPDLETITKLTEQANIVRSEAVALEVHCVLYIKINTSKRLWKFIDSFKTHGFCRGNNLMTLIGHWSTSATWEINLMTLIRV